MTANLSLRPSPRPQRMYKPPRRKINLRFCRVCDEEILSVSAIVCSKVCSNIQKARTQAEWERRNRERRLAYYSDYHAEHREHRSALAAARWQRIMKEEILAGDDDFLVARRAKRLEDQRRHRERNRVDRERHRLLRKVMAQWNVSVREARTWIEQGTFPP